MLKWLKIASIALCLLAVTTVVYAIDSDLAGEEVVFLQDDFQADVPDLFVLGIKKQITLRCLDEEKLARANNRIDAVINGTTRQLVFTHGEARFFVEFDRNEPLSIKVGQFTFVREITPMPLWLSIIPPLLVIALALVYKEVVSSLVIGIVAGASIAGYYAHDSSAWWGLFRFIDTYLIEAMTDSGHVSVMVFSVLIGGIVAVISKNGGMQAVINRMSRKATNAKSGQLATYFMGIAIFFDDYANTLVVGNTMRPLTDKLRISREKLSYIVDSTAAPVAAVAFITTWIGAELGYIQGALDTINARTGIDYAHGIDHSAYSIFLHSLEYAYYPILTLVFMLFIILLNRDYGPMYKAEVMARSEGVVTGGMVKGNVNFEELQPAEGIKLRMINAILPIAIVIFGTMIGLLVTGWDAEAWSNKDISFAQNLADTIGRSDSYKALLWASMCGLIVAVGMTAAQKIQTFTESIDTSITGFKTMINALVILILAWSLAALTGDMNTADYLAGLASGNIAEWAVPVITFIISFIVAFSTGTSWGTMAIVYPIMLPLSWELSMQSGISPEVALSHFFNVSSCVLAGAVMGDHCSPISDTTILSSLATQCNHIQHVRTQMPYSLTVGAVSILLTTITAVTGIWWALEFLFGTVILFLVVRFLGKKIPDAEEVGGL